MRATTGPHRHDGFWRCLRLQAAALWAKDRSVVKKNYAILPPPDYKRLGTFTHIFSGPYAAGYYGCGPQPQTCILLPAAP